VMKIGVLALQGDFAEHIAILDQLGVQAVQVRLPEQLSELDGLIIPGGESTTIARLLERWQLLQPIRDRAEDGMATWGTCAGAIVLANEPGDLDREALHLLDIEIERNAFGRQVESFEADMAIPALGEEPFHGVFIRAPRILSVGPGVEVVAQLEDGTIAAARHSKLLATIFHPELTQDPRFHELFLHMASGDTMPIDLESRRKQA